MSAPADVMPVRTEVLAHSEETGKSTLICQAKWHW